MLIELRGKQNLDEDINDMVTTTAEPCSVACFSTTRNGAGPGTPCPNYIASLAAEKGKLKRPLGVCSVS